MGHVGHQLHLHPLAAGLLLHRRFHPLLDVMELLHGLAQVAVLGQGEGGCQVALPDGCDVVGQCAQVTPKPFHAGTEKPVEDKQDEGAQVHDPGKIHPKTSSCSPDEQ